MGNIALDRLKQYSDLDKCKMTILNSVVGARTETHI